MVRAKFVVTQINQFNGSKKGKGEKWGTVEFRTICLSPFTNGSKENKMFGDATPCGKIEITICNPEAYNQFVLNGEYYIDFKKIPEDIELEGIK